MNLALRAILLGEKFGLIRRNEKRGVAQQNSERKTCRKNNFNLAYVIIRIHTARRLKHRTFLVHSAGLSRFCRCTTLGGYRRWYWIGPERDGVREVIEIVQKTSQQFW